MLFYKHKIKSNSKLTIYRYTFEFLVKDKELHIECISLRISIKTNVIVHKIIL